MGTLLFLLMTTLLALFFYINDTKQHKLIVFQNLLETHFKERNVIKEIIRKHQSTYPALARVVLSFADNQDDVLKMVKKSKKVEGELHNQLDKELDWVIAGNNEDLLNVLRWYFLTCATIASIKSHEDFKALDQEVDKIITGQVDKTILKDNFCFA
nr:MAG TPA: hypothetical protein [Bacteriophage sp.]